MDVIIHKNIEILNRIFPNWEQLKESFYDITIFQDKSWLNCWWEYQSNKTNISPYIVEIRVNNKMIGIIPLYISWIQIAKIKFRILKPIGSNLSDYLIPILSKDYSPDSLLNIALKKIYDDRSSWDFVDWGDIPENSFLDSFFYNKLMEKKLLISREKTDVCPYLNLSNNIEIVNSKLSKSLLKEIIKKEKKMKRNGTLIYSKVTSIEEIEPVMNKFFEFHCERYENMKTSSRFRFKEEREYTMKVAKSLLKSNLLHLSYLIYEGEIISVEYAMTDGNNIYLYLTAFDQNFSKYSVGNLLLYKLILDACKNNYEVLDFTRGDEDYKSLWGTSDKFNIRYQLFNRTIKSYLFKKMYNLDFSQFMMFRIYLKLKGIFNGNRKEVQTLS